ncbi:MAG: hypothetical protein GF355_11950, partial [Candidatus Eisenbacteria bacterium]|nr:hypothetical protein [Candidatus Eisenbacteria bacterium]
IMALMALLCFSGVDSSHAQGNVDIIDLHHNTSNGEPAPPYTIGTPVSINGVVTVGYGTFTTDYTDVWVQDATAGIMVYKSSVPYQFAIGDSVTISGTIDQYRGMTEVVLDAYTVHASGAGLPEPLVVTCDDVEHAFLPDYSEPNEGRLVRINNVTWTGSWPSFSGPITLHDDSGTCVLYIDGTTGVQNMTPPTGTFDVVGVIKQYAGFSPPYTGDYEILPRSPDDFTLHAGPQIIDGPRETDMQSDRVTIHVETEEPSSAWVNFGLTASHEMGSATDGEVVSVHDIVVDGLDPATIYHYEVVVENDLGQLTTADRLFSTGSAPGGTGEIAAIFNKSVDNGLASYENAAGGQDLAGWIVDRINATQVSIDVALYSFDLPEVADALIAARDRGVRVRFVYDDRDTYQTEVLRLIDNGIPVIDDAYGDNSGSGSMHHKLWIFDALSDDPAGPWVYSGSWNLTVQGTNTDAQNVVMIQDQALARTATAEFDEMWGSSTITPDPDLSRFGSNKTDNTPKLFLVGGRLVEMYFAPSDGWLPAFIEEVGHSDYSMQFCILSFTRYDLTNEMEERWMTVPGMQIRGVFDSGEGGNSYSQYHPMHGEGDYAWDPPADVWLDAETGTLHHKYMVIDGLHPLSDPVVATGSANWSNNAVSNNDENFLLIHDPVLANVYNQEFAERYRAAGGSGDLTAGVAGPSVEPLRILLGSNPVSETLELSFSLPRAERVRCELYTVGGRRAHALLDETLPAGPVELRWNLDQERRLASGRYFLRIATPQSESTRPVVILR